MIRATIQCDSGNEEDEPSLQSADLSVGSDSEEMTPGVIETSQEDVGVEVGSICEEFSSNEMPLDLHSANDYDCVIVEPAGPKCHKVDKFGWEYAWQLATSVYGNQDFDNPVIFEHEEVTVTVGDIFAKLEQNNNIEKCDRKSEIVDEEQDQLSDSDDCRIVESPESASAFAVGELSSQRGPSRNAKPARPKGRKRKRGKSQACDKKREPRPLPKKKTKKVVAKKAEDCSVLRRNPSRAVGAPADYNENKGNPRGNHLTSEYTVNLLRTCKLPRRAFGKRGPLTGTSGEDSAMSDTLWPGDTLERATLVDVFEQIPTPPSPPTWGTVTHHILQCVLNILKRHKSKNLNGFDSVAGNLKYIESLLPQLIEGYELPTEMEEEYFEEKEESDIDENENEEETVPGPLPHELTDNMEEIDDVSSVVVNWASEDPIRDAVLEQLRKIRAIEERLRDQSAVLMIQNLLASDSKLSKRKKKIKFIPVPGLDILEDLLEAAAYVYCLTNEDVREEDVRKYLSWAYYKKEARNFN